jgi:hypothetical protein
VIITTVRGDKVSIDARKVINAQESWHENRRCRYVAMEGCCGFSVWESIEALDDAIKAEKGMILDDPSNDCTPYQHPAFDRGQRYGVQAVCRTINRILDGNVDRSGTYGEPELQELRERLLTLLESTKLGKEQDKKSEDNNQVNLSVSEIKQLKHMLMMNANIGGPRT